MTAGKLSALNGLYDWLHRMTTAAEAAYEPTEPARPWDRPSDRGRLLAFYSDQFRVSVQSTSMTSINLIGQLRCHVALLLVSCRHLHWPAFATTQVPCATKFKDIRCKATTIKKHIV